MTTRWIRQAVRCAIASGVAVGLIQVLSPPASAVGSTIFVRSTAHGANNGTSWRDAYKSLQTALGTAVSGDRIWVAKGTYTPTNGSDRTLSFSLKNGVAVYGGFAGTESKLSQRKPLQNLTILSGDIGAQGYALDNSEHVVNGSFVSSSAILDGFKVVGGYNFTDTVPGAGILVRSGSPRLRNLVVGGGIGYAGGGIGIYDGANPSVTNVTLTGNFAGGGFGLGGAAYIADSSPVLSNVTFVDNSGQFGGGLYVGRGAPLLTNVTFSNNTGGSGEAIYADGPVTLTVRNSIVWDQGVIEMTVASSVLLDHSIVRGGCPAGATCTAVQAGDPKLGTLGNLGGSVPTVGLRAGSAAIDAGQNSTCAGADARGVARPQGGGCDLGAVELRALTFRSQAAYDGWLLEQSESSSRGGTANAGATTLRVGDDSANRQYRGLVSFDTASVPDQVKVVAATLLLKRSSTTGTDPFTTHGLLLCDARTPFFGSTRSLVSGDFQAASGASGGATVGAVAVNGFLPAPLQSGAVGQVSKKSTTQLRLRFQLDDDNDGGADYVSFFSGNAPSARRPMLRVYYLP